MAGSEVEITAEESGSGSSGPKTSNNVFHTSILVASARSELISEAWEPNAEAGWMEKRAGEAVERKRARVRSGRMEVARRSEGAGR